MVVSAATLWVFYGAVVVPGCKVMAVDLYAAKLGDRFPKVNFTNEYPNTIFTMMGIELLKFTFIVF